MNADPHGPVLSASSVGEIGQALRAIWDHTPGADPQATQQAERWMSVIQNDSLTREEKQRLIKEMSPNWREDAKSEIIRLKLEIEALSGKTARHRALVRSLEPFRDWETQETCRFALQKNDCSRLHKLTEACESGLFFDGTAGEFEAPTSATASMVRDVKNTFVVRHDWAAALDGAVGISDEVRLPYEICAFEFRITDKTLILIAAQREGGQVKHTAMLEGAEGIWFTFSDEAMRDVTGYAWKQVRAICIALDAQVAERSVIRAPAALNAKREKNGKPPIADFHVVDLSRRARAVARVEGGNTGRRVRMHFRRGHWRHYETHTTWINWMLVGDPDLGFIDKEYRI